MEYVLFAFGEAQAPIKTKLSKLRHLDSLFFFLLIVALLFFQIFQHHQLRQDTLSRRYDTLLEELLQERIPQLQQQLEELRSMISEDSNKIDEKLRENKQLTLVLARQLGLPTPSDHEEQREEVARPSEEIIEVKERGYEVIEIEPNSQDELDSTDTEEASEEGTTDSDSFPEEQVITSSEHSQSCTYLQYLTEWQQQEHSMPAYHEKRHDRINTSSYVKMGVESEQWWQEVDRIRQLLEQGGKTLLVGVLIAGVLLLTFQKRKRGKQARSFIRDLWRKIWQERKRVVKQWKEEQLLVL